jgi:hypothetical protein
MVNGYKVFVRYVGAHFDSEKHGELVTRCNYMQIESTPLMVHRLCVAIRWRNNSIYL